MGGLADVSVDATVDPVVKDSEVDTEVGLLDSCPGQVPVRQVGEGHTEGAHVAEPCHGVSSGVRGSLADGRLGGTGGDTAGSVLSPRETQLQEVERVQVLDEILVGEDPRGGCSVEVTPLVARGEGGVTVTTEVAGQVILVGEVVVQTGEITDGLGLRAVAVGLGNRVGRLDVVDTKGGGSRETGEVGAERVAVGGLTGVTQRHVEVVPGDVLGVGEDLVDVPGAIVGSCNSSSDISGELAGVLHLADILGVDTHLRLVEHVAVTGVTLALEGHAVAQTGDERDVDLRVGDTVEVHALALAVGVGIGVILTCSDERAGGVVVRHAVVPVLETLLAGIDIRQRGVPHRVADVGALSPAVGPQIVSLHADGQPVGDIEVNLTHGASLLVVVTFADTLLAGVVAGDVVVDPVGTSGDGDVVLLADTLAGDLVKPVDPLPVVPGLELAGRQEVVIGGVVKAGVAAPFLILVVDIFSTLLAVEAVLEEGLLVGNHLRHAVPVRDADAAVEIHDGSGRCTLLRGDDDNTVSGT